MKIFYVNLLLCVGLALAAPTEKVAGFGDCKELAKKFSTGFAETGSIIHLGFPSSFMLWGNMFMDSTNGRKLRMNATSLDMRTSYRTHLDIYQLNGFQYTVLPSFKLCFKTPMPSFNVMSGELPGGNAGPIPLGVVHYGGMKDGMDANVWRLDYVTKEMEGVMVVTVSNKTCTPVGTGQWIHIKGSSHIQFQMTFNNMTGDVKDPSVFTLPDYCQKSEGDQMANSVLMYSHYKKYL